MSKHQNLMKIYRRMEQLANKLDACSEGFDDFLNVYCQFVVADPVQCPPV